VESRKRQLLEQRLEQMLEQMLELMLLELGPEAVNVRCRDKTKRYDPKIKRCVKVKSMNFRTPSKA